MSSSISLPSSDGKSSLHELDDQKSSLHDQSRCGALFKTSLVSQGIADVLHAFEQPDLKPLFDKSLLVLSHIPLMILELLNCHGKSIEFTCRQPPEDKLRSRNRMVLTWILLATMQR